MSASYPFEFLFMTNKPDVAEVAARAGSDFILIDLEVLGKAERQRGRNTIISDHAIADIAPVRDAVATMSRVIVRVNPLHQGSAAEIDACVGAGADVLMLPMYRSSSDARRFVDLVGGRAASCLLLETRDALESIDETVQIAGIDRVHVGLNDLHLSLALPFMFLVLARGLVDRVAQAIRVNAPRIAFGFGGGALLDARHPVSPADVLAEHVRVGSHAIILSRTFHGDPRSAAELRARMDLARELSRIRECVATAAVRTAQQMEADRVRIAATIEAAALDHAAASTGA